MPDTNNNAINVTIACDQLEVSSESVHITVQLFKYDKLAALNYTTIDTSLVGFEYLFHKIDATNIFFSAHLEKQQRSQYKIARQKQDFYQ